VFFNYLYHNSQTREYYRVYYVLLRDIALLTIGFYSVQVLNIWKSYLHSQGRAGVDVNRSLHQRTVLSHPDTQDGYWSSAGHFGGDLDVTVGWN